MFITEAVVITIFLFIRLSGCFHVHFGTGEERQKWGKFPRIIAQYYCSHVTPLYHKSVFITLLHNNVFTDLFTP